jgi:stress response protein YsnF
MTRLGALAALFEPLLYSSAGTIGTKKVAVLSTGFPLLAEVTMRNKEQDIIIPLVTENLSVSKREVKTRVLVKTRLEQKDEIVCTELLRDEVEIERVPMNLDISEVPEIRHVGGITIVPVVEEVLVVEKKLVLVEEIHVRRVSSTENLAQPVPVFRQRVEIERHRDDGETA